jgi:hypothetical protein
MESNEEQSKESMKKLLQRHWKMVSLVIGVIIGAVIVAVFTFLKVVADAQVLGLVPVALGQWTVGYFFTFILQVIFWELVFVASWTIPLVVVMFILWYKKLPDEERKKIDLSPKRGTDPRRTEGGGFFSFLVGVVWLIIVWITGRWNLAFQAWTFNDWIYTWFAACLWILLPLCIAGLIYIVWSMRE